jgi:chromosome partitioning protein
MRTLAAVSQKGGQSKSTVIAHLGYCTREVNLRLAIIDLDPQASLTEVTFMREGLPPQFTPDKFCPVSEFLGQTLNWDAEPDNTIHTCEFLFVHADHEDDDTSKFSLAHLKSNLAMLERAGFNCVLIDTQGGLTGLTEFALQVATHVVIPFQFGGYDIAAIDKTINLIEKIRESDNRNLKILGMLPAKVETGSQKIMSALRKAQSETAAILPYHLANRIAVQEATQDNRPVWRKAKTGAQRAAANEWKQVCIHILSELA